MGAGRNLVRQSQAKFGMSSTVKSTPRKTRLRIDLKLFFKAKPVYETRKWKTQAIAGVFIGNSAPEWTSGTVRVWYSVPNGYWNEADFETEDELKQILSDFTEWDLVKELI